jgi:hypothetical protein
MKRVLFVAITIAAAVGSGSAQSAKPFQNPLSSIAGLQSHQLRLDAVNHRGRQAVHAVNTADARGETYVVVPGVEMQDGTIDLDVAGLPAKGASEGARGFIGVAFRIKSDQSQFECFYIRPTNGRADDQLRRNHSTQYISFPGFPWEKLRKDAPGVYESYTDLVPGEWTHLRVDVRGQTAKLFVGQAEQPALIVNDLKLKAASGQIGLWTGAETDGYFSRLSVTAR